VDAVSSVCFLRLAQRRLTAPVGASANELSKLPGVREVAVTYAGPGTSERIGSSRFDGPGPWLMRSQPPTTVDSMLSVSCPVCGAVIVRPPGGSAMVVSLHITSCRRSPRPPARAADN
jgi:hypothetical protein